MRLIVFDLDDTIYHERDFVMSAYRHIARVLSAKYGFDAAEMVEAMASTQLNPFDSLEEYLTNRAVQQEISVNEDIPWMINEYRTHFPEITPMPGVIDTLRRLCDQGFRLAMITDGRIVTQMNKIEALGLTEFIENDQISISEAIGAEKYYPEAFERMMEINPDCDSFFYVGDNPMKDFVWPNRLGWTTIQINDDGRNVHSQAITPASPDYLPQYRIDSFDELAELI